jgi:hypothetical protein
MYSVVFEYGSGSVHGTRPPGKGYHRGRGDQDRGKMFQVPFRVARSRRRADGELWNGVHVHPTTDNNNTHTHND